MSSACAEAPFPLDTIVELRLLPPSTETDLQCELEAWSDASFVCHLVSQKSQPGAQS